MFFIFTDKEMLKRNLLNSSCRSKVKRRNGSYKIVIYTDAEGYTKIKSLLFTAFNERNKTFLDDNKTVEKSVNLKQKVLQHKFIEQISESLKNQITFTIRQCIYIYREGQSSNGTSNNSGMIAMNYHGR